MPSAPTGPTGSHPPSPTRPPRTVLVADDHGPARRLVALALAQHALVLEARHGREALELARALEPDLVILDLSMAEGPSGIDTCRALRTDPATARMPVVICTASTRPEHAKACAEAGADAFLLKPYRTAALQALVLSLLPARTPSGTPAPVHI